MIEYRKVGNFYLNGNFYNMYLDNKNKHFFLKTDLNDNISYVSLHELVELINYFDNIPNVMNIRKGNRKEFNEKIKIIPKILVSGVAVLLSSTILMTVVATYQSQKRINEQSSNSSTINIDLENYISYVDEDKEVVIDKELVVDTYVESDQLNYLYIYDMDYLDKVFDYDNVSLEQLYDVIENNNFISNKYKELLKEYSEDVFYKYPDAEFRVFYENLKTLEVVECDKQTLVEHTLSVDSYGCYIRTENRIYVLKDYEYKKGTWEYQIIFHEFSHCLRTGVWNLDGKNVKVQLEGLNFSNVITAEALNSLFTVSLFDYEERDIAYQLQSNYHSIFLECMDNYDLSDYVNHSLSYYAKKLDEFNNDDNYATVILELIQLQYDDYHSNSMNIGQDGYYSIYDYVSSMYYKKYLNSDMSYDEARRITDSLLEKILYDVPKEYNIDITYFYDYLDIYCRDIGIKKNVNVR